MDIYKINMTIFESFNCTNEKEKCKNIFFILIVDPTLFNTSTSDHEKHGNARQHLRQKNNLLCESKV